MPNMVPSCCCLIHAVALEKLAGKKVTKFLFIFIS